MSHDTRPGAARLLGATGPAQGTPVRPSDGAVALQAAAPPPVAVAAVPAAPAAAAVVAADSRYRHVGLLIRGKHTTWLRDEWPINNGGNQLSNSGCDFFMLARLVDGSGDVEWLVEKRYDLRQSDARLAENAKTSSENETLVMQALQNQFPAGALPYVCCGPSYEVAAGQFMPARYSQFFLEWAPGGSLDSWLKAAVLDSLGGSPAAPATVAVAGAAAGPTAPAPQAAAVAPSHWNALFAHLQYGSVAVEEEQARRIVRHVLLALSLLHFRPKPVVHHGASSRAHLLLLLISCCI